MEFAREEDIRQIIETVKTIAVVGLSSDRSRASNHVAEYLQKQGYRIVPVNPSCDQVLGETCYPDVASIPFAVDLVDIFRRSEEVPPIVDEAIAAGAKGVWMQEDVVNPGAAEKARNAGLLVVMDRCILKEHTRMARGY